LARSFEPGSDRDGRIKAACRQRGCTLTALVNDAIDLFLAESCAEKKPEQAPEGQRTFYTHNSNPDIKLVDRKDENGKTYYFDTEGRKWMIASDGTLVAVARIRLA